MSTSPSSPPDDVVLRPTHASPPSFAGMTPNLPSALRDLRRPNEPPKPSEMTALAMRLRGVHLDRSPISKVNSSNYVRPLKLQFQDMNAMHPADNTPNAFMPEKENNRESPSPQLPSSNSALCTTSEKQYRPPTSKTPSDNVPSSGRLPPRVSMHSASHGLFDATFANSNLLSSASEKTQLTPLQHQHPSTPSALNESPEAPFNQHILKIVEGKSKWKWPDRCASLKVLAAAITSNAPEAAVRLITTRIATLAPHVRAHLGEIRPSVITATLRFFDAVVASDIPCEQFVEAVVPGIVEIASGHSLTAVDAARSLAVAVERQPTVGVIITAVENPARLCEVLTECAQHVETKEGTREQVRRVLQLVETCKSPSACPSPEMSDSLSQQSPDKGTDAVPPQSDSKTVLDTPSVSQVSPQEPETPKEATSDANDNDVRSLDRARSLRISRMSWRARLETPALMSRPGMLSEGVETEESGDMSQEAAHKGRVYTADEVEEIRRAAIETVMEKLDHEHKEESEKLKKERVVVEEELGKERDENKELRAVLQEFEMTMNSMVSQTNSQWNSRQTALEEEKNKLKSDLVEMSEAFEKLKEKHVSTKQVVERMEAKETRLMEQNQSLKENMVELQTWSNELKANTEKKLTKAFENVTSFRAMYIDKEAHAQKAMSDAEKMKTEVEKGAEGMRVTAAKLAHCESELHKEQDMRADLAGQVSGLKGSVQRLTVQRDRLQADYDKQQTEVVALRQRTTELEGTSSRINELQGQLEGMRNERQELKARAFDDMKRIQTLQAELQVKEKEIEEMGNICDEVMARLEQYKLKEEA